MFEDLYKYLNSNFELNKNAQNALMSFFESMNTSSSKLENAMLKIGNKYSFEKVKDLKTTPHIATNTLFFWRELFEFPMSIALDEEEIDDEFMLFINDGDITSPLFEYIDVELERTYFDIYHSWVAFNFQKAKLYESGIPMGITVNSDIVSYYFNDFSYDNFSNYHHVYDSNKRLTRPFNRNLSIEEIFIRTNLIHFPYKRIILYSENEEQSQSMELENSSMIVINTFLKSGEQINKSEQKFNLGNRYNRKAGTDIDELINYFESTINKGFKFNLKKCSIQK